MNRIIKEKAKDNMVGDNPQAVDTPETHLHILPLRYWWITVAIVVFFIGGISGWQRFFQGHVEVPPAVEYNSDRLSAPAEGLRIVSMGDSYSRFAFPHDDRLDKAALDRGLSIKFTRFTKDLGKARHFAVLLPEILASRPDFVFLEAEPFIMGSKARGLSHLAFFRRGIRNIKKKIEGRKSGRLFIENSAGGSDKYEDWTTKPAMVKNRIDLMKKRYTVNAPKLPQVFEEFFTSAQAQGTRVVLLDLGHSKIINEAFSQEFQDRITANLKKLEARYPIEVWRFPSNLPLTHYTDIAHLNIHGQRIFTDWILGRLTVAVKKND